jgi:periplasmic protein CpxP/Spy
MKVSLVMMPKAMEKNRMRTAAVLLCGAMLTVLPAMAQQDTPPQQGQGQGEHRGGMNPERRADRLQKALGLTADQTTQLKTIFTDEQAKGEALRNDTSVPQDERRSKMMELRKDEETKVHAVLTDEQKAKYDAMQQERMRGRQNGGDGNAPAPASAPSM